MSSYWERNDTTPGYFGRRQEGGELPSFNDFNAPVMPSTQLVQPVSARALANTPSLTDLALGQAKEMLDAVRDRRVSWQTAKKYLEPLSTDDKKTLAATRTQLSEDEKRALGLSTGGGSLFGSIWGGLVDYSPAGLALRGTGALAGATHNVVGDTISNFAGDVTTLVKDLPAGLVKTGGAVGADLKTVLTTDPRESSSILASLTGHELHKSATQEEILNPTIAQYAYTYGPLFHGDPGKTAARIQDHPLGPVLDMFALASFGTGAALRTSNAISRVERAAVIEQESPTLWRMGKVDRTTETYQPLGYNKEFYVRPTTQQIKNEPYLNHFSVLIDPKTGDSLFSPVGSSHDEIYSPLHDRMSTGDKKGVQEWERWNGPDIIQGTGMFDPRTGKVAGVNIDPDHLLGAYGETIPGIMQKVRDEADSLYITKGQLDSISKTNEKGTLVIKMDTSTNRYDPHTGEKLGPTYHVVANGRRDASNFPDLESAQAYAQSRATGGILPDVLVNELREYFEPAPLERGVMRTLNKDMRLETVDPTPEGLGDSGLLAENMDNWPSGVRRDEEGLPDDTASTSEILFDILDYARYSGTPVQILKDTKGAIHGVAGYSEMTMPFTNQQVVYINGVVGKTPGAGLKIVAEIAKAHPGKDIHLQAASDAHAAYYEQIGARRIPAEESVSPDDVPPDAPPPMIIPAEDAAKLARGEAIIQGPRRTMKVPIGKEVPKRPSLRAPRTPRTGVAPLRPKSRGEIFMEGFTERQRGSLIDVYERARNKSHNKEIESIIQEVVGNILTDPTMTTRAAKKERFLGAFQDMAEGLSETARRDLNKFISQNADSPEFAGPARTLAQAFGITAREASDLVRAGAVFLRPAYIPNNWAGNGFLNAIHQGVYAPINLAKALVMDKHLGVLYTRGIDQSMGYNAANLMVSEKGTGYAAAATDPVAKLMGSIADQPFRRAAWLHEARRAGYKTLYDVKRLMDQAYKERTKFEERGGVTAEGEPIAWDPKTTPALHEVGKIARAAQEEIIKFGKYNDIERSVLRNLIFVYSWMRGAARYFGRFPMQHPIQAAAFMSAANIGQNWLNEELGGVPNFLIGAIPVGKDDQGNTTVINPFSVNPLGTGQELFSAAASMKELLTNPDEFNKYSQTDPIGLLNPLIQNAIEAYTGGRPIQESIPDTIAAVRLKENLEHPGRGQVYPTTQDEALGQYFIGSMFPRKTSQAAITRSLQRERADQPDLRIDDEVTTFERATGEQVPKELITAYRQDLKKLEQEKDFQHEYAKDHGSQGFSNMPAANRAEAGLEYLTKYHLVGPSDIQDIENAMQSATTDEEMNDLANAIWRLTGAGQVKDKWDSAIRGISDTEQLTPARP